MKSVGLVVRKGNKKIYMPFTIVESNCIDSNFEEMQKIMKKMGKPVMSEYTRKVYLKDGPYKLMLQYNRDKHYKRYITMIEGTNQ